MSDQQPEMSTRDARAHFADLVNSAVQGKITYITSRGRRVAAIVPVSMAEAASRSEESGD